MPDSPAPPSLSSMWSVRRFATWDAFEAAAREAGFTRFEINYEATPEFLGAAKRSRATITSLHTPLPAGLLPTRRPHYEPSLTALDEEERQIALKLALGTIDLASDFAARAVVVHLGGIPEAKPAEIALRQLHRDGDRPDEDNPGRQRFLDQQAELIAIRERHQPKYLDAARRTLDTMAEHAARRGVAVGLESRHHVCEIPNIDEMELLLDEWAGAPVGYWHDSGHVEQQQRLGFASHEQWLQRHAGRMIGAHLHDIEGRDLVQLPDHRAPGLGELQWDLLERYLPAGIIRTCEFGGFNEPAQVTSGLHFLQSRGLVG